MHASVQFVSIYALRLFLRLFHVCPVKRRRLLFAAHEGKAYNCNPQYIFEALYERFGTDCEYIWCLNDRKLIPAAYRVECVKYLSLKYLYYLVTSGVVINDVGVEPFIPKRKGQLFINTWHGGGAYKKGRPNAPYKRNLRARMTDYVISSCRKFSEVCSAEDFFNIGIEKFLPIGMPRNDLFFRTERHAAIRKRICERYGMDEERLLVLYAPTFRGAERNPDQSSLITDAIPICAAVEKRFHKPAVILSRCHTGVSFTIDGTVDVNDYQDMQELLIASDLLITDYSSSIWDFSLTHKPAFLYTPDLEAYERSTGFHVPIAQWPYPYALTMEELCASIRNYDASEALCKIEAHHAHYGSYERGTATEEMCDIICRHLENA